MTDSICLMERACICTLNYQSPLSACSLKPRISWNTPKLLRKPFCFSIISNSSIIYLSILSDCFFFKRSAYLILYAVVNCWLCLLFVVLFFITGLPLTERGTMRKGSKGCWRPPQRFQRRGKIRKYSGGISQINVLSLAFCSSVFVATNQKCSLFIKNAHNIEVILCH